MLIYFSWTLGKRDVQFIVKLRMSVVIIRKLFELHDKCGRVQLLNMSPTASCVCQVRESSFTEHVSNRLLCLYSNVAFRWPARSGSNRENTSVSKSIPVECKYPEPPCSQSMMYRSTWHWSVKVVHIFAFVHPSFNLTGNIQFDIHHSIWHSIWQGTFNLTSIIQFDIHHSNWQELFVKRRWHVASCSVQQTFGMATWFFIKP